MSSSQLAKTNATVEISGSVERLKEINDELAKQPGPAAVERKALEEEKQQIETLLNGKGDAQLEQSFDRYAFVRNAWLQRREFKVHDGNVEEEFLDEEALLNETPEPAPEGAAEKLDPAPEAPPAQP